MSEQHAPEPWGYGIVRDGKVVGIERTIAVAKHWVDADYVPLVPMSQRDELLEANRIACEDLVERHNRIAELKQQLDELLAALEGVLAWDKRRHFPIPYRVRDPIHAAIASVKGGAA